MSEYILAAVTAAWLGFLCSISPCPLATNIAAISFVSRKVGKVGVVLSAGVLYTLGRTITYAILGILLVGGLSAAPELSHLLQKYMNLLMGPFLIIVAMVLLDMLTVLKEQGEEAAFRHIKKDILKKTVKISNSCFIFTPYGRPCPKKQTDGVSFSIG